MQKLIGLCALGVFFGCASGDKKSKNVDTYYSKNREAILLQYHSMMKAKKADWVLHIHFRGNDFGSESGKDTQVDLAPQSNSPLRTKAHPFVNLHLNSEDAALALETNYSAREILGTLKFRFNAEKRALRAMQSLYDCHTGLPEGLARTLLIVSGGSHGASEAEDFVRDLEETCHKKPDAIVTGDAIQQPMSFPMARFDSIDESTPCLNFFQQSPVEFIRGQPLSNCFNVKITGAAQHDNLQKSGMFFIHDLFSDIEKGL